MSDAPKTNKIEFYSFMNWVSDEYEAWQYYAAVRSNRIAFREEKHVIWSEKKYGIN